MRRDEAAPTNRPEPLDKSRIEAFSDGVIAVAITLLVLDLRVPQPGSGDLARALASMWPNYLAYVISFVAIGIMWLNHHTMMRRLAGVDHSVLVLNLLLLLCIVALPFTTALVSEYLDSPADGHLAAAVYAGSFLVTSIVFATLQLHLVKRRTHLLREPLTAEARRRIVRRAAMAPPAYLIAGGLAFWSPYLTLAACAAMGIFYLLPPRRSTPR